MNHPSFDSSSDLWTVDGSLRDIYVHGTSESDWSALLSLAAQYPCRYAFDGQSQQLPQPFAVFAHRGASHLLGIGVGKATINCHFFVVDELELDLDPREVLEEATHTEVMRFLVELANRTMKPVSLTAENSPSMPYLVYEPAAQQWSVHTPQFP